jgi:hypothetical protein
MIDVQEIALQNILTLMSGLQTSIGLIIRFIENPQNVTTNNYDSLSALHTPKITVTTAHVKSSQSSLVVAW